MASLRPRGADDLGLRQALSDRLLPLLVAAMVFLAALTLAGAIAAGDLARHWQGGAGSLITVQVPWPEEPALAGGRSRAESAGAVLAALQGFAVRRLSADELGALLWPWLGDAAGSSSLALPAVFELRGRGDTEGLAARLAQFAPGVLVERNGLWLDRLTVLASSLQAVAGLALLTVIFVAAAVIAIAARAGLGLRRDAIEIVHGLGATDAMIAGRFARRVTWLAFAGGVLGAVLAIPLLLELEVLTAPFQPQSVAGAAVAKVTPSALRAALPPPLWAALVALPPAAAMIGWLTTQATVRGWLGRLP